MTRTPTAGVDARAGQRPAAAGMANVTVLDGGMRTWHPTGAPVNRGHQRWSLERQLRLVAEVIDTSISRDA